MNKCPDCTYESENLVALSVHYRKTHKKTAERLRIELFHSNVRPTCACGCNGEVRFCGIKVGFSEFILGHHSRVHNNWGHNAAAQLKSQDVRRQQISDGEWTAWNKGETKETDTRIAAYGRAGSIKLKTDPNCQKQRAEHMSDQWRSGSLMPLTGSAHGRWKGGTSSLQQLVRANLFRAWSRPIMIRDRFTCQHCQKQSDLCVHHDKERFAAILMKAMGHFKVTDATTLTFEQKQELSLWVIDYHLDNDVSGIVLCQDCHDRAHADERLNT